eukprot:CAMPEP_0117074686 /NCGR_PEP_ID=MMETSP0472-20121206/52624_1 /TAXON_ID=693140 ORGANISM="Tiarina fusus, Strain LIS" /NCGR_SAMPLE_ID=MMETSP0472 /ASSEMBLY_ACC=CAM_ASM_000603 /LENGTH=1285 /DNA_ID=CAMNT_0004799819 /DNA_START=111 /DNA_END=3968 /DNA_ORIENTATION=-
MHIKQITISNFRSFRQQPEIHPFAPTTNCVVGRNGSGKSNLFDAVQFVLLTPRFATLRAEERQALLHEGSGSAAVNAFVEVVFDNSDNRFSLENSDEVVLRRTVGSKKDEFFLQRKRATKQEVQSLLEGAGFSKSNPYFMVQQGKIQTICLMSDEQRLNLLQQVAGTTLYEDKKAESLVKMQENAQSIEKINSILADIDNRLNELHGEKEELTIYQTCDRTRKALEYTLYEKEHRKACFVLDNLEHERTEHLRQLSEWHEAAKDTHDHIQTAEATLKVKVQALKRNKTQLQHAEQDKTKAMTTKTQLDLLCQELQDACVQGQESLQQTEQELKTLAVEIEKAQSELAEKDSALNREQATLQKLVQDKDQAARQSDALYAKQGRGQKYSSKEERDRHLRRQIQELEASKLEREQFLAQQQDSLAQSRRQQTQQATDLQQLQQDLQSKRDSLESVQKTLDEKKREQLEAMDARKHAWRKAEELEERVKDCRQTMDRAVGDVRKSMPRATAMGVKALRNIVAQERLVHGEQYFGMVMENMNLKDPKFRTAVEVAAQNALFHVIVDNDATAARLMERLEMGRMGRVTFMPLNRLRVDHHTRYPQSNDVTPLLETCVNYDSRVGVAMKHVFDKKLLARTAEVASEWSDKLRMDCITLDGDLCSRKGALTGGYVDSQKSRLRAYSTQREAEQAHEECDREWRKAHKAAKQAEQDVTVASDAVSNLQHRLSQFSRMVQSMEKQVAEHQKQMASSKKNAERIELQVLPPLEREITSFTADMSRLAEEIGTELTMTLSDEERATLAQLKETSKTLQTSISRQSETVQELQILRGRIESRLEENLLKRRQELTQVDNEDPGVAMTAKMQQDQRVHELEERRQELAQAIKELEEIDAMLEQERQAAESIKLEVIAAKNDLEKWKSKDMHNSKLLDEAAERSEKIMSKKSMNIQKRENYTRKIQELGSLPPPSELEKYNRKSITDLEKALEKVNKKLKKYSHVNKKAFDQYVNFSEQRENLLKRKEELDRGAEKVKELVESLDRQKDEAINRTFRGVSKHFAKVFKELVPLGEGELMMRTALDDGAEKEATGTDDEMESDPDSPAKKRKTHDPENLDVSLYRGIGIKVRFSKVGENFIMSQLSGGQKALVALALIFAIQRCDPAPFYIFDELDQALDSSYRQAVANVIQRQASNPETPTQFITSTFRPELVQISKNCYGISHQNKVSSLHHMTKNDALRFIANLMSEEEAVGQVSNVKPSRKRRSSDEEGGTEAGQATLPTASEEGATTALEESTAT